MPYFLFEIDNAAFYATEKSSVDPAPLIRWPWLDPFWGVVEGHIEGVLLRDPSARNAEMIVQAEPDFLTRWNLWGDVIKGHYPTGEMIVDKEGTIFHVTASEMTELKGMFAHDLFAQPVPARVDDLECELYSRAEEVFIQKVKDELASEGQWVDETDILTATIRCLGKVDLLTADYADIDECIEKAMRFLAQQHLHMEDLK